MAILKGAALVGQSGGPTAAINATLAGVIKGCIENPDAITKLYGMRNGIEGFIAERTIDLSEIFESEKGVANEEKLCLLSQTPAAALGSCRKKLPKPAEDKAFFDNYIIYVSVSQQRKYLQFTHKKERLLLAQQPLQIYSFLPCLSARWRVCMRGTMRTPRQKLPIA